MIDKKTLVKSKQVATSIYLFSVLALFSSGAHATVDIQANMRSLIDILLMLAPFLGFVIFASGVYQFYKHAKTKDERYGTSSSIFKLVSGAMLVSINWFFGLLSSSFIPDTSDGDSGSRIILAVDKQMAEGGALLADTIIPQDTIAGLLGFVAFVGIIAFINGIMAIKSIGDGRHDERDIYKAITRIIGGLICVNIKWASCLMGSIFGISILC